MPSRSTENIVSRKQAKFNSAHQQRNHANSHSIRTPPTWLNLLMAAVSFTCIIENTVALDITRRSVTQPAGNTPANRVCTSEVCRKASNRIKSWMDATEEPCNNFYQFACGGWINKTEIPSYKYVYGVMDRISDDVLKKVTYLLKSNVSTAEPRVNRMIANMRKYHSSCMAFESMGPANVRLNHIFSQIPLPHINRTGWANMPLERFIAKLQELSIHTLFLSEVTKDVRNTTLNILKISQPPVAVGGAQYPSREQILSRRRLVIAQVLQNVYHDLNINNVVIDVDALVNLEIRLANATIPELPNADNRWTVSRLKSSMSNFNWSIYLEQILASQNPPRTLRDDYNLMVPVPEYFNKLNNVLGIPNVKVMIGQLATFWLVRQFEYHLTVDYRNLLRTYDEFVEGQQIPIYPRWKICLYMVRDFRFIDVMSRIYSQEYFDNTAKATALGMISSIKSAFKNNLMNYSWIDQSEKTLADRKIRKMTEDVGFPPYIYNTSFMENKYGWMNVGDRGFIVEDIQISKGIWRKTMSCLWAMNIITEWPISPVNMNAFYSLSTNTLILNMPAFARPFFDKDYPKYLNFGGIGAIIGHEITHGFDNYGSRRDENGNFRSWWSNRTLISFTRAAQCFVNQYNMYEAPYDDLNMTVNGRRTLGENIADNGGVKNAFKGYKDWVKRKGQPELKLPDLDYTPEQLFFINFAQTLCTKSSRRAWTYFYQYLGTAIYYAPRRFRVIGALSNNQKFQEIFGCRPQDKMNAPNKCLLW